MRTRPDSTKAVSRALVAACEGSETRLTLSPARVEDLVAAARFHRVAPLVYSVFHSAGHPDLEVLSVDRLRTIGTHLSACGALEQLASALADLEWVAFKGPVFSELAHPVPGLRSYNDVDVLVAPSSLREVCGRLDSAGWRLVDYRDMLVSPEPPGEIHWVSPGGVLLDLHWSMLNMHSRRRLFDVPTQELLGRRVQVPLGGTQVWTLDPSDALVHACLHAALSGANKLVYLVDVDHLSRNITDWDEVVRRAGQWRAQVQVALVLGRARRVLGTRLPEHLDERLGVSRLVGGMLALTDRAAPVPRGRGSSGVARFVARAVRADTRETLRAVRLSATRGLRERAARGGHDTRLRVPADAASLEHFLTAVEATVDARV